MEYRELAEEFCRMRVLYAKKMARVEESLAAKGEANVLLFLSGLDSEILAGQIAKTLDLSPSRITNILNSLERKELICKNIDREDKRRVYISLTEKGRAFIRDKREETLTKYENIFRRIGLEDTREYLRILKKFAAVMEEIQSGTEDF